MKKILFLLLCTVSIYGQTSNGGEQEFDYGIKNNSSQTITTPTYLATQGVDGTYGKIPSAYIAKTAAVQDSLNKKLNLPTGFLQGLQLSINADPTKFNIAAGYYVVTDFSDLAQPVVKIINYAGATGLTPAYLATANSTYVALDINGAVVSSASPFTDAQRRTLAIIGNVVHSNNTTINVTNEIKAPIVAFGNQLHDFMRAIGFLNESGNVYSANGANLQINKSVGDIFGMGINAADYLSPHKLTIPAQTALTFAYRFQNGTQLADTQNINPNIYDVAGVSTPTPSNKWTIQRINLFQSGLSRIQPGQTVYNSFNDAVVSLPTQPFVTEQNIADNAVFRCYLIVQEGTTNIASAVAGGTAQFVPVDKFGNVIGNGSVALTYSNIVAALGFTPANDADVVKKFIKSNESLTLAQRKGDVLYGILDQYTGEEMTLSKVTGTPTVDGIIYFQLGSEYFKREFENINVKWFGAKGDGTNDDTAEIQQAINFVKPSNPFVNLWDAEKIPSIYIPTGKYTISSEISIYSGVTIYGDGETSKLVAHASFTGVSIFVSDGINTDSWIQHFTIKKLSFSGTKWAFQQQTEWATFGKITDITLYSSYGIDLGTYSQATLIDNIVSYGEIDILIRLAGNTNVISRVYKEGQTGTTTDPYIIIQGHTKDATGTSEYNILKNMTIEGATSSNKALMSFDNCIVEQSEIVWMEPTNYVGFSNSAQKINNSVVRILSPIRANAINMKYELTNKSNIFIDDLDLAQFIPTILIPKISDILILDSTSFAEINKLTYGGQGYGDFVSDAGKIKINYSQEYYIKENLPTGIIPSKKKTNWSSPQNLLVNPSFESGDYGWGNITGAAPTTITVQESTMSAGKSILLNFGTDSFTRYGQYIDVTSGMVGRVMTLVFLAKVTGTSTNAQIAPVLYAPGIVPNPNDYVGAGELCIAGQGAQRLSLSFVPQSAGSLFVGFQMDAGNGTNVELDEFNLSLSNTSENFGTPNYKQIELNGNSISALSAIPTTGTWKVGDKIFKTNPNATDGIGWVCTTAGSPGTWKVFGNIDNTAPTAAPGTNTTQIATTAFVQAVDANVVHIAGGEEITGNKFFSGSISTDTDVTISGGASLKFNLGGYESSLSSQLLTGNRGYDLPDTSGTIALVETVKPYKVYTALLSQTGTSAPTATVLENTLGGTVAWTRTGTGAYLATLSGVFTANKTSVLVTPTSGSTIASASSSSVNDVNLSTALSTTAAAIDGVLSNATIEIRVYN